MVKVSIKVRSGAACFRVAVRAESVEQAVSLVGGRYSGGEVQVKVPDDYEGYYLEGLVSGAAMAGSELPVGMAA